jgi:PAS domain S-box-containing protein
MEGYVAPRGSHPTVTIARYAAAVFSVAAGVLLSMWLQSVLDPMVPLLVTVLLAAWFSGLWPALCASVLATLAIDYFFEPPLYTLTLELSHLPHLAVFVLLATLFASASSARRKAEQALREARDELEIRVRERTAALQRTNEQLQGEIVERRRAEDAVQRQANLLEQTHDAIVVWEFPGAVVYWNRGAEQLYGYSRGEAIGRAIHELLQTEHPAPLTLFEAALERDGEWNGELTHTTRDSRQLIVESRQVLIRDPDGRRFVLETNRDITERKQAELALEELAGRLIHAQEQERSRIGRELHDHISQLLGVLMIKIDQLRAHPATPSTIAGALNDVRHCASDITDDVHRLSHRLHSSALDYLGLVPALQKLMAEFSDHHNIPVEFVHTSLRMPVPADVALCLFRVTEESLNNVARHSHASMARVDVSGAPDGIHLRIKDDGKGFDMTQLQSRAGLGFVSMQERLRVLRGTVRIDSAPSRGTTIDVWVPSAHIVADVAGETQKPPIPKTASDISAA